MSHAEVNSFFAEYVFGFMQEDIHREIERARAHEPAGNFLCALALLSYTEVLGGVRRGTLLRGNGRANFDEFFRELGPEYARLLDDAVDVYSLFRCGMAHEYLIKGTATVSMLKGVEPAGVAIAKNGRRYFCVERYLEAFLAAAGKLRQELLERPDPRLPPELSGR